MSEQSQLNAPGAERSTFRVPACDVCRVRKIKCDRNSPCSSCVASQIPCRTTKKVPEKKKRVLLSSRYDEGLANVNRKLEDLSQTLHLLLEKNKALGDQTASQNHAASPAPAPAACASSLAGTAGVQSAEIEAYEGESSFNAQSKRITETLGMAVSTTAEIPGNVQAAATAVQKLLQDVASAQSPFFGNSTSSPGCQPFPQHPELCKLTLPPSGIVLRLLSLARSTPQRFFVEFAITDEQTFANTCQKVYFPAEPFNLPTWVVVNAGLYYLFRDLDKQYYKQVGVNRMDVDNHVQRCTFNLDAAVNSIKLCIEPSLEAVLAFILAASVNMENAKGSVAWRLTISAARMCLDLGLHRMPRGLRGAEARRSRLLFWFVYSMDKGLAFNFGRTPTIHDYDVSTERPLVPDDLRGIWGTYFMGFIDFAEVQGNIYEQLFSAQAQNQRQEIRTQRAAQLGIKLIEVKEKMDMALDMPDAPFKHLLYEAVLSIDIVMYSMLTLVYRVIPPSPNPATNKPPHPLQFHDKCVTAARTALTSLVDAWKKVYSKMDDEAWRMLINWTLLFVPFMPYIVVFGNAVATVNKEELALLRDVVKTIQHAAEKSTAIHKLYFACKKFLSIAELIVEHKDDGGGHGQAQERDGKAAEAAPTLVTKQAQIQQRPLPVMPPAAATNNIPSAQLHQQTSSVMQPDWQPTAMDFSTTNWNDFPMTQHDWDDMLNEFDLGLGAESAREMGSFFEQYMAGSNTLGG